MYDIDMRFAWDPRKNLTNQKKHGITFEKAKEIFDDPLHLSFLDQRFNYYEERWITIGMSYDQAILVVAHLYYDDQGEETLRIISAREASQNERRQYEQL